MRTLRNSLTLILGLFFSLPILATSVNLPSTITSDTVFKKSDADTLIVTKSTTTSIFADSAVFEAGIVIYLDSSSTLLHNTNSFQGALIFKGSASDSVYIYGPTTGSIVSSGRGDLFMFFSHLTNVRIDARNELNFSSSYVTGTSFFGSTTQPIEGRISHSTFANSTAFNSLLFLSDVDLDNCILRGNSANQSLLRLEGGSTIQQCNFINNTSPRIMVMDITSSGDKILKNTFRGNSTTANGGIVYIRSNRSPHFFDFSFNVVDSNYNTARGGVFWIDSDFQGDFSNNSFTRNHCTGNGGVGFIASFSDGQVHSNIYANNSSEGDGGALYISNQVVHLSNDLFVNNSAKNRGGAIASTNGNKYFTNLTIVNNKDSLAAGGIFTFDPQNLNLYNSIVRGNETGNGVSLQLTSSMNVTYSNIEGGYAGTGNIDANPLFDNPTTAVGSGVTADIEGWSIDLCNSPCRDAGTTNLPLGVNLTTRDIYNNPRVAGINVDMGATETIGTAQTGGASNVYIAQPLCADQTTFTNEIAFYRQGTPTNTVLQADTGNGFQTIPVAFTPGLSWRGDTLVINNVPAAYGGYSFRVINAYSCVTDTSLTFTPTFIPLKQTSISQTICGPDSVFFAGIWRKSSGQYNDTLTGYEGCDSIHTLSLTVIPYTEVDIYDTICPGDLWSVWPNSNYGIAGTYTRAFSHPSAAQCDSTVNLHLSLHPNWLDSAGINGDTTLACEGAEVSLDASNPNLLTYDWSDGTTTGNSAVFNYTPPSYPKRVFITVTDNNGCTQTGFHDIESKKITNWGPTVDVTNNPFITFSGVEPQYADYVFWDFGDGDTSSANPVTHEYTANGNVEYCYVAGNECGEEKLCNTIEIMYVGQEEFSLGNKWVVAPNPFRSTFTLSNSTSKSGQVYVYDLTGTEVFLGMIESNSKLKIDLEDQPAGMYLIRVTAEQNQDILRVIKE